MKNNLGIVLKRLRESRNLTQQSLADMSDVGRGTIGDIESQRNGARKETLDKLSKALNLNTKEKIELYGDHMPDDVVQELMSNALFLDDDIISIPVLAIVSAGAGFVNFENPHKDILLRKNGFDETCYLVEVTGDSMHPTIPNGSYIVVDPTDTEILNNRIYVVKLDEETYIKRVSRNDSLKAIILKSINPKYDDVYITEKQLEEFTIQGRATKVIHEFNI